MRAYYRFRKGLDIPLAGAADRLMAPIEPSAYYAVKPPDFPHITPKLLIQEGDSVVAGTPLFASKDNPLLLFTAPISGTVTAIVRGAKRRILEIRIAPDGYDQALSFDVKTPEQATAEEIKSWLLSSGCWPYFIQRPYGLIANPQDAPKAIYISCFDSAPLAPDYDFMYDDKLEALQMGLRVLQVLCPRHVYLGLSSRTAQRSVFRKLEAHFNTFQGPHPAGNPGVQIHHVCPVGKGQVVWTLDPEGLCAIGTLFITGQYSSLKVIAITGGSAQTPRYIQCHAGLQFTALKPYIAPEEDAVRCISGNVLTGDDVGPEGFLGFYHRQVTFLPEGHYAELLGWANPLRLKKYSASRSYLSHLAPLLGKRGLFNMDTNTHGDVRAFVLTAPYQKVLPMDIYVSLLIKAVLARDIDKMEALGILEVLPEDLALCEFVCPSKIEIQTLLQEGIDYMIKEVGV